MLSMRYLKGLRKLNIIRIQKQKLIVGAVIGVTVLAGWEIYEYMEEHS